MILSVRDLASDRRPDVCIIGSGPAGLTLAIRLHAAGKDVLVLEGGEREISGDSQELYAGTVIGDDYYDLASARLRYLGGTSNHWNGWCRPLDAIDFTARADFPETGWPISKADLDPYLAPAKEILELEGDFADAPLDHGIRRIRFLNSDPPVRFGEKYGSVLESDAGPSLCLGANLVGFDTEDGRVTAAHVRDFDGGSATVRAGVFVLACGGIENSRLLLHFNAESGGRLVPRADTLGRYWMEHHYAAPGVAVMDTPSDEQITFALDERTQTELAVLNCRLRIQPIRRDGRVREMARSLACRAPRLGEWVYDRIGRDLDCVSEIQASWEQEPRAENRIELSTEARDAFAIPTTVLHWARGPNDRKTLAESVERLGEYLARSGQGRLRMETWLQEGAPDPRDDLLGGWHHMGGTRMSARPGDGVVDSDLKVWGQDNLYLAGSSVFPAGGQANPTFTIVQLSLRLADHLEQRL